MLNLPKSTELSLRITKQKFYEKLPATPALKHIFTEQIKSIRWRNKIAAATMNIAAGGNVTEIEVFEVKLNGPELDETALRQIDRNIPYHIIFLLECEGKYQAWTAYKETGGSAFKVGAYYHTEWMTEAELPLKVDGLDTDAVYENFVRQIAGSALAPAGGESLKESVERDNERQRLQKLITLLESKVRKEKQFNKQVELNAELKAAKLELEELEKG